MADVTINDLTEDTSPASGDYVETWDSSANASKKASLSNLGLAQLLATAATNSVATSETRNNTSFGDLATVGPSVSVTIGASGKALVILTCNIVSGTDGHGRMGYTMSGANTASAANGQSVSLKTSSGSSDGQFSYVELLTGLSTGSTTFTAKYNSSTTTATFLNRRITVIPV